MRSARPVPRPRAILVVSAHWYVHATAVTAMPRPRTIHDFFGFPPELFDVDYQPPGLPELYDEVADIVHPTWVGADLDSWGIDHGAWSVLMHAFPDADIPVVQLSINALKSFDYHLQLGAALAPLREDGVLVIGSGNVVHNLGGVSRALPDAGFDWAQRFDERGQGDDADRPDRGRAGSTRTATSTSPSRRPTTSCRCCTSPASRGHHAPEVLVDGYAYGSLSMTAYTGGGGPRRRGGAASPRRCCEDPPGRRQHLSRHLRRRAEPSTARGVAAASFGRACGRAGPRRPPPIRPQPLGVGGRTSSVGRRRPRYAPREPARGASVVRIVRWVGVEPSHTIPTGVSGDRPFSTRAAAIAGAVSTPSARRRCRAAARSPASRPATRVPGRQVAGDDHELVGEAAVGHRDARQRGDGDRAGDTRHHLDRDPGADARVELLHAAAEHERVAALERTTRLPASARSTRSSLICSWAIDRPRGSLEASMTSTSVGSEASSDRGARWSATTTSACASAWRPRTVIRPGSPGPPPTSTTPPRMHLPAPAVRHGRRCCRR